MAPIGIAVDVSVHAPGSTSDLTMMMNGLNLYRSMLKKEDNSLRETGREPTQLPNSWAVLVDKRYQGAGRVLQTFQPK
ncbi:hypothetical protein PybrP1_008831 [[Pythium] brassicae (nom. inval.)]|nr:hypothetical protein PybrP1_008831 [[Pythium] brassicae (nom. inval.)]